MIRRLLGLERADERAEAARRATHRLVRALQWEARGYRAIPACAVLLEHTIAQARRDLAALGLGAEADLIVAVARRPELRATCRTCAEHGESGTACRLCGGSVV